MRNRNAVVAISLGLLVLLSYFYITFSKERGNKKKKVFNGDYGVDEEVYTEENSIEVLNRTHIYPYITRCTMWNTQPPPARLPRWIKQYNESCRKYAYVPFNSWGGFGHKTDNFMNGLILASALNSTYAMTNDFELINRHSSLSGIVNRFGLGAYSPMLGSLKCKVQSVGYNNERFSYEDIIRQAERDNKCNTVYSVYEYFAGDRSPVRWHMAHMALSSLASTRETNIAYSRDKFNIAVHMRYGSHSPYDIDNFLEVFNSNSSNTVRMIKYFTEELERINVPYSVHFFTAGKVDDEIINAFPGAIVHGKGMSVVDTVQHFIESDLLFCLMSSMCRSASIMSTRPLVINGYPTGEAFFFDPCPRGLSCDLLNRTAAPALSLRERVRDAGEKWLVSHRLNCPLATEEWPAEDTSIDVSGPEQCDTWGPPLLPRMLINPYPDPDCPRYGYVPLDEARSGSYSNVLRWIRGAALANLLNVTFVFGGRAADLAEEVELGLGDSVIKLHSLDESDLETVNVSLDGVVSYSAALERLENVSQRCGTVYRFGDADIRTHGWTYLTLARAVQKRIADTMWEPSLWAMDALNIVVDMTGADAGSGTSSSNVDPEWVTQSLDTILHILNRSDDDPTRIIVVGGEGERGTNNTNSTGNSLGAMFAKYKNTTFVPKPRSVAEHVKHLVAAADLVFCPRLDAEECHIAALAASRPGFVLRGEEGEGRGPSLCPSAGMCSVVLGGAPATEAEVAFVHGISERWNVGKYTKCL